LGQTHSAKEAGKGERQDDFRPPSKFLKPEQKGGSGLIEKNLWKQGGNVEGMKRTGKRFQRGSVNIFH